MPSIFIVDNEESTLEITSKYLIRERYQVETFSSVEALLFRLQAAFPDMFILNIMSPSQESLDLYRDFFIRSGLPVIFTVTNAEALQDFRELDLAGGDFLIKPFSPRELLSRVRMGFRHSALPLLPEAILAIGNLKINPSDRHTTVDDREVMLTPQEYELLLLLIQQPQRTFNRPELLDRIWGCDYVGEERAVDNLVKRLRKKLKENGSNKNVKTVWGCGYRFDE